MRTRCQGEKIPSYQSINQQTKWKAALSAGTKHGIDNISFDNIVINIIVNILIIILMIINLKISIFLLWNI